MPRARCERYSTPAWMIAALVLLMAIASGACSESGKSGAGGPRVTASRQSPTPAPAASPGPVLPSDLTLLTVLTKDRALAQDYQPPDLIPISAEYTSSGEIQRLRRPAAEALTAMLAQARREGLMIKVNSAFRSYQYQAQVLKAEIAQYGCATALLQVAAPGHSEHQLGLAADLTSADVGWDLSDKFGETPEGRWLLSHAAAYGFVLSYPLDKTTITGYAYEPWHFRYVTPAVAQDIVASGKTPSEYLLALGAPALSLTQESPATQTCR